MSGDTSFGKAGKGVGFWGGLIFAVYAIIAALAITGAVEGRNVLMILMLAPLGLLIPLVKAANRSSQTGGAGCMTTRGLAQRLYLKRVAIFTSLYMISIALMVLVTKDAEPSQMVRVTVAVLPGLAIIGIFWAIGRLIVEEQDEFLRMLVIRQSLVATGLALSAASIWGFLENADVVDHLDAYWWAVVWLFGQGVGAVINRIQYGSWGAV